MGVNRVFILGNLGADPEKRSTPSQISVCNLRVATTEKRKNAQGEWVEQTEWHSVVVWGKSAENCSQYLSKGSQVFVEGRLQTRKWQDQEGKDRYKTEIVASSVQFVGNRSQGQSLPVEKSVTPGRTSSASELPPDAASISDNISLEDDDIPF